MLSCADHFPVSNALHLIAFSLLFVICVSFRWTHIYLSVSLNLLSHSTIRRPGLKWHWYKWHHLLCRICYHILGIIDNRPLPFPDSTNITIQFILVLNKKVFYGKLLQENDLFLTFGWFCIYFSLSYFKNWQQFVKLLKYVLDLVSR